MKENKNGKLEIQFFDANRNRKLKILFVGHLKMALEAREVLKNHFQDDGQRILNFREVKS